MRPRFTIITVTYNAADCLEKTIQSVLTQTYQKLDYIIIDGGSKDGTIDIIRNYADQLTYWISEPDKGIYDGMNKGIIKAEELHLQDGQERYVLMLNADDTLYASDTLQQIAEFLERQAEQPDVLCGAWMIQPEHGSYLCKPGDLKLLPRKFVICHQATLVKVSILAQHPFNLKYRLASDFGQLSGLYLAGYSFLTCPDIVVSVMILNAGATERNWKKSVREGFDIVRSHGCYHWGEETWLIFRKSCVRLIKRALPSKISNAFFAWLGKHYKAM